jgi:hypothetical protein
MFGRLVCFALHAGDQPALFKRQHFEAEIIMS